MATFTSRNHRLSDLLLLLAFLALPLTLGELITPALADFLGKKLIAYFFYELYSRKICLSSRHKNFEINIGNVVNSVIGFAFIYSIHVTRLQYLLDVIASHTG